MNSGESPYIYGTREETKKSPLIDHLDHIFSLHDFPRRNSEVELGEEQHDLLRTPAMKFIESNRTFSIDKLFKEEELCLGDPAGCLDSSTLPRLFCAAKSSTCKKQDRASSSPKVAPKSYCANALRNPVLVSRILEYVIEQTKFPSEKVISLSTGSSLMNFLISENKSSLMKASLAELFQNVLTSVFFHFAHELEVANSPSVPPDSIPEEPIEDQSECMSDVQTISYTKRKHKQWTVLEENKIRGILSLTPSLREIETSVWERLAKEMDRTVGSILAKAKLLSKESEKECKSKINFYSIIESVFKSVSGEPLTKEEIVQAVASRCKISEAEADKPVSRILSKKFDRFPGIYRLQKGISILPKEYANGSVKSRLVYIFGLLPDCQGSLLQIKQLYMKEFPGYVDSRMDTNSNIKSFRRKKERK